MTDTESVQPDNPSKIWSCPQGCGYHIADGPVPDDEPLTSELIHDHMLEHQQFAETATRREVWLHIALGVARGMPEPAELALQEIAGTHWVNIGCADRDDVHRWAEWLGIDAGRIAVESYSSHRRTGFVTAAARGWSWDVHYRESIPPARVESEQALAAQVAAAILEPAAGGAS